MWDKISWQSTRLSLDPHSQLRKQCSLNVDRSRAKETQCKQSSRSIAQTSRSTGQVTAYATQLSSSQESRLNQRKKKTYEKKWPLSSFQQVEPYTIAGCLSLQRGRGEGRWLTFRVRLRGSTRTTGPKVITDPAYWKKAYLHGDQSRLTAGIQMRQSMSPPLWTESMEDQIRQWISPKVPVWINDIENQSWPAPISVHA